MWKKCRCFIIVGLCAFFLSGCGNAIPEMTEEQNAQVCEYAANLLLSYSGAYESRLVDTSVPPPEEKKPTLSDAQQINGSEEQKEEMNIDDTDTGSDSQDESARVDGEGEGSDVEMEPEAAPSIPLATVLGLEGFQIQANGYEICDSYPVQNEDTDALMFTTNPANGNKLVVLHLQVTNTTDQAQTFNTLNQVAKYKIVVNGSDVHAALMTMLENDFTAQNCTIDAGQQLDTVLVTEVPQENVANISSVSCKVKCGDMETICE